MNDFGMIFKGLLLNFVGDLDKLSIINKYNYELTPSDFEGIGSTLFSLCLKYKGKVPKITQKIMIDEGLKVEEVKEYFKGVDKEYFDNFILYIEEVQGIKGLGQMKEIMANSNDLIDNITDNKDIFNKVQEIANFVKKETRKIKDLKRKKESYKLETINETLRLLKEDRKQLKTGIASLDDVIGGFSKQEISIVSGTSGAGKTTFIIQFILYVVVVLKKKVLFVNLELSEFELYGKFLGLISGQGYDKHSINKFDLTTLEGKAALEERITKDKNLLEKYVEGRLEIRLGKHTEEDLIEAIEDADDNGFELVVCDYFQLVEVEKSKGTNRTQRLSELQENVREVVRKTDLAFIWLAQLSENKNEEVMEYKIGWSDDLKKGAGLEIRVWREKEEAKKNTFKNHLMVGFKKTRFAKDTAPLELAFNGNVGRIGEFEFDNEENIKMTEMMKRFDEYENYGVDYEKIKKENKSYNLLEDYKRKSIEEEKRRKEQEEAIKKMEEEETKQKSDFEEVGNLMTETDFL